MTGLETVCYDIRSFFQDSPALVRCPWCGEPLRARETPPSPAGVAFCRSATIPLVETHLHYCPRCGWWALREMRVDCELCDGCGDYLVTVVNWSFRSTLKETPGYVPDSLPPWKMVLTDPARWQGRPLALRMAKFLFGPREVRYKQRLETAGT